MDKVLKEVGIDYNKSVGSMVSVHFLKMLWLILRLHKIAIMKLRKFSRIVQEGYIAPNT
jgi:hypothetical protein